MEKTGHLEEPPWQDPMTRPLAAPGLSPPRTCKASPADITDGRTGPTVSVRYDPGQTNPNNRTMIVLAKDWRTDDRLCKDGSYCSVLSEERSKQVDGIYLLYSDSLYPCYDQPITSLATIGPLLSQPTGRSKRPTPVPTLLYYSFVMIPMTPLCL